MPLSLPNKDKKKKKIDEVEERLSPKKVSDLSFSEARAIREQYGSLKNYELATDKNRAKRIDEQMQDLNARRLVDAATARGTPVQAESYGKNNKWNDYTTVMSERKSDYDRAVEKLKKDLDAYSPIADVSGMKNYLDATKSGYDDVVSRGKAMAEFGNQFKNEEDYRDKTAGYGTGVSGDSIEDAAKRWKRHVEIQEQIKSRTNSRAEREDLAAKDKQYMDTQGRSDQAVVNTFRNASERSNYNGAPNAGDLAKYYNESDYIRWLVGRDDPNNDIDDENYKFERNWTEEQGLQENPETKYEYLTPLEEETFWAMLHYYEDILSDENKGKYPELTGTPIEYAQGWIDEMAYTLGYREDVEAQKRLEKAPTWAKGLATVAANAPVVSWMGAVDAFGDWLGSVMEGKEYNPYGAHSLYMTRSREMQQSTAEDLSKKTPQWIKDLTDEDFGSLFNSAISAEKFVAGGAMLGPVLYTIEMGMETAPASAAEYRAKGIEKDKANLMAATDAAIEMGTEYISAELFVKNYLETAPTSATGVLMRKLVQDVVEGTEEVVGTYAGAAMQQVILGSQSEVSKKMRAEMADGKSAGQAFQAAWDKVGEEARHAFVNAIISSAFVSTPGAVIQGTSINKAYRNEGSFISAEEASALRNLANDLTGASDIALDKNAARSVERAAKRYDKNASAKNTGKLSFALRDAVEKQNVADVRKAMSENGVSDEDVKEFAPLFERMAEDPEHTFFTEEETEKLLKNETLGKVYTDLFGPESSAGSRMEKYALARAGANVAEGGERTSVRAGSNLYNTPENIEAKVSDTGMMIDTETNGEIALESKDPIVQRDGKTYLNTSAGEISTENIKYADAKQAELIESVADLPQDVANTIVENYQGQENVREYVDGMREGILLYGYSGASMSAIPQSSLFSKLDKVDKNYALSVGRALAQNDAAVREKVIEIAEETSADSYKKSVVAENPGLVRNDKAKAARLSSNQIITLDNFGKANGTRIEFVDELKNGAEGEYDPNTATIRISLKAKDPVMVTLVHETIHRIRNVAPDAYNAISDFVQHGMTEKEWRDALNFRGQVYETTDVNVASEEMVADVMAALLKDTNLAKRFVAEHRSAAQKIRDVLHDIANAIARFLNGQRKGKVEEYRLTEIKTLQSRIIAAERLFENALKASNEAVTGKAAARVGINIDAETESANPSRLSLRSWKASEYASNVKLASADLAKALNVSKAKATQYINDVNSIAAIIAADQNRLDFDAAEGLSAFVSNVEYGGSIDFSTICKKRRLMTGTMAAIQDKLGNDVLSVEDYLNIRSMMKERGYEVSCGLCYVEGSRANMGEFASKFRELYAKYHPEAEWQPTQSDVVNADKVEKMRTQHPDVYEEYVHFWNNHGKLRDGDPNLFASQQRPKLFQADTEYNGEILNTFKKGATVEQKNLNGGLRIQSFSDFEIIHLLDTMQVIMDMSRVGLAGQAYTKVPDFAWAVGGTGLKVNLSMIAKGVDENGNIIYDEVEGMKKSDAETLRNEYSDNVGTILVVFNDEQLSAALNDPFIDFIIPFHRSQWASKHYDAMGLPKGVKDFTSQQNEKLLRKTYHEFRGKLVEDKARNFMPNEYWDFNKAGKENAEEYLRMCAAANKKPKFSNLLVDNGDGSFSLQSDGSTDGYWKLLIDFKMYNNEGVGVPQNPVRPEFNIEQAERMLNEYEGGHKNYPVAQDVVDDFVKGRDTVRQSRRVTPEENARYMELAKDPVKNEAELSRMVEEAARKAGYDTGYLVYRGDSAPYNVLKTGAELDEYGETDDHGNLGNGLYFTPDREYARRFAGRNGVLRKFYLKSNMANLDNADVREIRNAILQEMRDEDGYFGRDELYEALMEETNTDGIKATDVGGLSAGAREALVRESWQAKLADPVTYDDNGNIIPLEERFNEEKDDIRYSLGRGKGYDGYSMSNNAREAYGSGEMPISKWTKSAIVEAVTEINPEAAALIEKVNLKTLKDNLLEKTSWHHTSKMYNATDFYSVNEEAVENLTADKVKSWATRADTKATGREFRGGIHYLEWGGTRNHPKATEKVLNDVNIEERGSFYIVTDDSGKELLRKKIGSNGTSVVDYEAEARRTRERETANRERIDRVRNNSSAEATALFEQFLNDGYSSSMSGNLYARGRKPTQADVANGLENFFRKGEQRLVPSGEGYAVETWNGNDWESEARESRRGTAELVEQYGKIPEGERPFRNVEVPERTSRNRRVSQTVRTVLEAEATPDTLVPTIEDMVADGDFSYETYTDDAAIEDAQTSIKRKGYATALADWINSVRKGQVSKANTTMGWELYRNAAESGDTESALTVLRYMVGHQRNAAQALQASRILKKMSPEAQLYNAQKSLEQLLDDIRKTNKNVPDITIDPALAEEFLNARDQETRDKILGEIFQDAGRKIPPRLRDKFQAFRYLAMLGNPRTHIRNIAGNLFFAPVVAAKNLTGTAIESAVRFVSGGKFEGTKGNILGKGGAELFKAAWDDYANVMDEALGEGKYTEEGFANKSMREAQRIFRFKPLEAVRRFNSAALEVEDLWFNKPHYVMAMAQYCKARGITTEQIRSGEGLDAARQYAIKEAQKATYRDTNAFSDAVSRIGRYHGDNKVMKVGSKLVEGILPFRKTPANILVRGLEYSPAGLLKSITYDAVQVKKGNMTGAEMIDHLSAGLTGTGLAALGLLLASFGIIKGHGDDDDKKSAFDKLTGHQRYSLEIGGTSITLDWLAPEALPFFVGVNLYEEATKSKDGLKMADVLTSITSVTEPLMEMSCLQGLNDLFENIAYVEQNGLNALTGVAVSMATSYLTQYVPTILGQFERTFQDKRFTTYTDKNSWLPSDLQYTLGQVSAKVPIFEFNQIPYIDAWGRTEATGNFAVRAVSNFVNPAYVKQVNEDAMSEELLRLYNETGEASVFPQNAPRYIMVNGERKDFTPSEYVKFAQTEGTTAYAVVGKMADNKGYKSLDDETKQEAVKLAYTYAKQSARVSVGADVTEKWTSDAMAAKKAGVSPETYILAKAASSGFDSLKDKNGETIDKSKSLLQMQAIYNIEGISQSQRQYLIEHLVSAKSVWGYSKSQVDSELAKMKKQ